MKKLMIASLALFSSFQSNSYTIHINYSDLKTTDTFGLKMAYQAKACKLTDTSYKCHHNETEFEGMPLGKFKQYMNAFKNSTKEKLNELTIFVNNKKYASCNHLEKKNGNSPMRVTTILKADGCH